MAGTSDALSHSLQYATSRVKYDYSNLFHRVGGPTEASLIKYRNYAMLPRFSSVDAASIGYARTLINAETIFRFQKVVMFK